MFYLNNDNAKAARGQPGKIQLVIETFITKLQDVYTPEYQLPIEETIRPFRRCMFFRVYIKGKTHKYGIKTFEL
jgi:hypothetical protein